MDNPLPNSPKSFSSESFSSESLFDLPVPISALQHFLYCPRQCALIHIEQTYGENLYTLRGNRVHERAHEPERETIAGVRLSAPSPSTRNGWV